MPTGPQRLREWMDAHEIGPTEMGRRLDVTRKTVYNWLDRGISPDLATAVKIERLTLGAVRAADWVADEKGDAPA